MNEKRKKKKWIWIVPCGIIAILGVLFLLGLFSGNLLMPVKKTACFEKADSGETYRPGLRVNGTHLEDENGEKILLRGLMVPELSKLRSEKKFSEEFFEEVFGFGGNVIRIPVHPDGWEQDGYYLWRYLDPVVHWAVQHDRYVILDMHLIGNIDTGRGEQMPEKDAFAFAEAFWKSVAGYFKDVPNVLFEVYNEPALIASKDWAEKAEKLVSVIRETGAKQVVIVGSGDYSFDLHYWEEQPLQDENVMYSAHVFPNRKGEKKLAGYAGNLPVIVTEWGYIASDEPAEQKYLVGTKETYGIPMLETMEENGISWVACWYDDGWEPPMFKKDSRELTEWGQLIRETLGN